MTVLGRALQLMAIFFKEQPNKRRRLSEEVNPMQTQGQEAPREDATPLTAVPSADASVTPEATPSVPMDVEVRDEEQLAPAPAPDASSSSQRLCGSKTCSRALTCGAAGPLCDKCRSKMKRRQAMTKQRFKLEPKKITVAKSAV